MPLSVESMETQDWPQLEFLFLFFHPGITRVKHFFHHSFKSNFTDEEILKYECVRAVTDNGERGMERMVCLMPDHASPASAPLLQSMTSSLNFFFLFVTPSAGDK